MRAAMQIKDWLPCVRFLQHRFGGRRHLLCGAYIWKSALYGGTAEAETNGVDALAALLSNQRVMNSAGWSGGALRQLVHRLCAQHVCRVAQRFRSGGGGPRFMGARRILRHLKRAALTPMELVWSSRTSCW
jgi:hypothetical protein